MCPLAQPMQLLQAHVPVLWPTQALPPRLRRPGRSGAGRAPPDLPCALSPARSAPAGERRRSATGMPAALPAACHCALLLPWPQRCHQQHRRQSRQTEARQLPAAAAAGALQQGRQAARAQPLAGPARLAVPPAAASALDHPAARRRHRERVAPRRPRRLQWARAGWPGLRRPALHPCPHPGLPGGGGGGGMLSTPDRAAGGQHRLGLAPPSSMPGNKAASRVSARPASTRARRGGSLYGSASPVIMRWARAHSPNARLVFETSGWGAWGMALGQLVAPSWELPAADTQQGRLPPPTPPHTGRGGTWALPHPRRSSPCMSCDRKEDSSPVGPSPPLALPRLPLRCSHCWLAAAAARPPCRLLPAAGKGKTAPADAAARVPPSPSAGVAARELSAEASATVGVPSPLPPPRSKLPMGCQPSAPLLPPSRPPDSRGTSLRCAAADSEAPARAAAAAVPTPDAGGGGGGSAASCCCNCTSGRMCCWAEGSGCCCCCCCSPACW